jgi:hypothetical protein
MESLAELSITQRKNVDISGLRATFLRHNVVLSNVVRLRILSHSSWSFLVKACPNTESLALEYNMYLDDLLQAAGNPKKLKHLEICNDTWRKVDIHRLHKFFPEIQTLTLRGTIGHEHINVSTRYWLKALALIIYQTFADAFRLFNKLDELFLTAIQQITDEEAFSDDCSGVFGCIGEMKWEHDLDEDQRSVAVSYFAKCPSLRLLNLVRTGEVTAWATKYCGDNSVRTVYSPSQSYHYSQSHGQWAKIRARYDEGFPTLFSAACMVSYCDERWDPPRYLRSRHPDFENWVSFFFWGGVFFW